MIRNLLILGIALASVLHAQSINSVPNQLMSGFSAGVGSAPIIATANNYLNNSGTITNQLECATTICGAGEYLAIVSLSPTATATLGTISLTLSFTDTAQAQTVTAINLLALTTKTPGTAIYPFYSTGTANITWSTTVSGISGSYSYNVYVRILKLS